MTGHVVAGSRLRWILFAVSIALVAAGTGAFLLAPRAEKAQAVGAESTLRTVTTMELAPMDVRLQVEVAIVLEPRRSVKLYAETRGPVIEVGAEALDRVEADQLLLRIDPLLAAVAVERAEAAVVRATSELALARANLVRRSSLAKRSVASDADLDDAENAQKVTSAALREARAEVLRARDDLAKKTIVAPFAGVLRTFTVEVGEYVQVGQQLGELLDLATTRATIGLADRDIVAVHPGQSAEIRVEAYPDERFRGVVLRVGAATDPQSRKFPVEIEAPNPEGRLLPGMVATVVLDQGDMRQRLLIPRDATLEEFGLRFAYGIDRAGEGAVARRHRIQVRTVPFRPTDFEVVSGLAAGDEIALSPIRQLRDGERVRIRGDGSVAP